MTWFTLIMIVMVVSIIFGLLFTTRYLFSGRALFWARITMLLFDVIGMGGGSSGAPSSITSYRGRASSLRRSSSAS